MKKHIVVFLFLIGILNADIVSLKKGWNFITLPTTSSLDLSNIAAIWYFDNNTKKWKTTLDTDDYEKISSFSSSKGYWLRVGDDYDVSFDYGVTENFDYESLVGGWNMLGSYDGITDFSVFPDSTLVIWTYNNGSFEYKAFDENLSSTLASKGYSQFTTIEPKQAFWLYKKVNTPPNVDFSISPDKSQFFLNENITFQALVSDDDNDETTLLWSINGSTSNTTSISFKTAGNYEIKLTATDSNGAQNTATKQITVIDEVMKPDISTSLATPKIYYHSESDIDTKYTFSLASDNNFNLSVEQTIYYTDINETVSATTNYNFIWIGKGYEATYENSNFVLIDTVYSGVRITATLTKGMEYFFIDTTDNSIQYKTLALSRFDYNPQVYATKYYIISNNNEMDVSLSQYNNNLSNFQSIYNSLPLIEYNDMPESLKNQILSDIFNP